MEASSKQHLEYLNDNIKDAGKASVHSVQYLHIPALLQKDSSVQGRWFWLNEETDW